MDEGFNTFSTARAIAQVYDPNYLSLRYFGGFVPWVFRDIVIARETDGNRLPGYRRDAKSDAQSTPTFRYFPSTGGSITYNKTALWLNTLERWLGWPTVQRIMSTHFETWKFKHPKPADFFTIANQVSGRDLQPFFDQTYRSSNVFDYGVQDVRGSTAIVRRYGEAIFPIDILVTLDSGKRVTELWDGRDRWIAYRYDEPISAVQVDPRRVLLLDVNYTNNSWTRHSAESVDKAATRWAGHWLTWLEDCLLSWAALV